jgi:hypothetical protein
MKKIKKFTAILSICTVLFCTSVSAAAEALLPEGTVAGLPESLTVMDEDGNSVDSSTGEYFFEVEDMVPGETYSKNIQIMNLREDKAYHIYFYAEPVDKGGNIDLEAQCTEVISLDGSTLYEGAVNGEGNVNMTTTPLDLGLYTPGEGRTLNCSITWDDSDAGGFIDYGRKLVDTNGTTIVSEGSGESSIYGEVRFKWIFYAVVDESYVPPKTGLDSFYKKMEIGLLICMGCLVAGAIVVVKRKNKKQESIK